MDLKKNEECRATISSTGVNGEGIVKKDGYTIFVPYALPNEKVQFKILKATKNYAFGKLLNVITPADERIRPKCSVFTKCGGCQLQHVKYGYQLKYKTKMVQECLAKIAGITTPVSSCIRSEQDWEYRNKLQLPITSDEKGNHVGFFAENSHRIVDITECPIHPAWSKIIISIIRNFMATYNVRGYNETDGTGILRHIVVREIGGNLIVVLVINADVLPFADELLKMLTAKLNRFSFFININKENTNVVCGSKYVCLYGKSRYVTEEFGISYEAGPETFLQINGSVRKKIYDRAIRLAEIDENTYVIDAYSGAGLMTAMCAKTARRAYGIEIVQEAVSCADHLAEMNGLVGKMVNICGACEAEIPTLVRSLKAEGSPVVVLLDPPRKGCEESVLDALLASKPDRIVYISCNPATLARDLGYLTNTLVRKDGALLKNDNPISDYEITCIQPYDMFPQTKHVESVVCLSRK